MDPKKEKAPAPSSNPYVERWEKLSKEQKEKIYNRALLAKANYDKLLSEAPKCDTLTTPRLRNPLESLLDTRSLTVRATYKDDTKEFQLPLTCAIAELKDKVAMSLALELDSFKLKYREYDGELILVQIDEDLRSCVQPLSVLVNPIIRVFVVDKVVGGN